jgi:hypothetical protein
MGEELSKRRGETAAHSRLKRLAFLWAQVQGYTAGALEVSLPHCRYRADVAAYRPGTAMATAIFECKQARPDLRRDNCATLETRQRLETVYRRRQVLEKHLRIHYPTLRIADSLFPEFDSHNFGAIEHRNYTRVLRELNALHHRLYDCTKFETIVRYRCANLFFLVLPGDLYYEPEIPVGWGALIEADGELIVARKPIWHETTEECRLRFLQRIATAGTRMLNRELKITFDEVETMRRRASL